MAGYHTEYSAMKFAFFFLGEYTDMIVISCVRVTLFFGGWSLAIPQRRLTTALYSVGPARRPPGHFIFVAKVAFFMLRLHLVPGTFPRYRFDQLMDLGWKWMIPLALGNIFVTGGAASSSGRSG